MHFSYSAAISHYDHKKNRDFFNKNKNNMTSQRKYVLPLNFIELSFLREDNRQDVLFLGNEFSFLCDMKDLHIGMWN